MLKTPQMSQWTPTDLFMEKAELLLSETERKDIQSRLPQAENGNYYADAVFEGGGVKGIAFLGALRCFDDAGVTFRKVAGTSAGAITAALLSAGHEIEALENIIGNLDFRKIFLGDKNRRIFNGNPNNDLQGKHSLWMIINLALAGQKGQYSSEPFKHWLHEHLKACNVETFSSLLPENQINRPWYQQKELKVVVSDLSRQAMAVLPDNLDRDYQLPRESFSIAEAVRLSMSIPFFFEPGNLGNSVIVDGGILSNFPLWIFDTGEQEVPKCPTFGFQLKDEESHPISSAIDMLVAMLRTMQVAHDRHHVETHNQDRVLAIDAKAVSTTQFNLTNDDKKILYAEGYKVAKKFLLNQWSWKEHLRHRGFSIEEGHNHSLIRQAAA